MLLIKVYKYRNGFFWFRVDTSYLGVCHSQNVASIVILVGNSPAHSKSIFVSLKVNDKMINKWSLEKCYKASWILDSVLSFTWRQNQKCPRNSSVHVLVGSAYANSACWPCFCLSVIMISFDIKCLSKFHSQYLFFNLTQKEFKIGVTRLPTIYLWFSDCICAKRMMMEYRGKCFRKLLPFSNQQGGTSVLSPLSCSLCIFFWLVMLLFYLLCLFVLYVILALWPPALQYKLPALLFVCVLFVL